MAAGKPPIDKVGDDSQDEATNALILAGRRAVGGSPPVTAYAIERSEGRLELAGDVFDAAPYGWVVAKGPLLGPVLQQAMQELIDLLHARRSRAVVGPGRRERSTPRRSTLRRADEGGPMSGAVELFERPGGRDRTGADRWRYPCAVPDGGSRVSSSPCWWRCSCG